MHIAKFTLDYDGAWWELGFEVFAEAHSVGLSASRRRFAVMAPPDGALDAEGIKDMHDTFLDYVYQLRRQLGTISVTAEPTLMDDLADDGNGGQVGPLGE